MRKPRNVRARVPHRVADSGIDQAILDWNNHNAYRSGSLRRLIDAKLVSWGHGGWAPTKAGRQRGLNPNHLETSERKVAEHRVADFNTLDDLVAHARDELGATHVLFVDEEIHLYFPRQDGTFEKAEVWQKDGYWHAQGPGARTIVQEPPENAQPIGGGKRRAVETQTVESKGFETRNPKIPGWYVLYKDGTFQGPHPGGEQGAKTLARILSRPELPVKVVYVSGPGHTARNRQTIEARRPRGIYHGTVAQNGDYVVYTHHRGGFGVDRITAGGTHTTIGPTRGYATLREALEAAAYDSHAQGNLSGVVFFAPRNDDMMQIGNIEGARFVPGGNDTIESIERFVTRGGPKEARQAPRAGEARRQRYSEWTAEVAEITERMGIRYEDVSTAFWRQAYQGGLSPWEAADEAVRNISTAEARRHPKAKRSARRKKR